MRADVVDREQTSREPPTAEPVSPELALVDPELASRVRLLLPDPGQFVSAHPRGASEDELRAALRPVDIAPREVPVRDGAEDTPEPRSRRRSAALLLAAACLLGLAGAVLGVRLGETSVGSTVAAPTSVVAAKRAVAPRPKSHPRHAKATKGARPAPAKEAQPVATRAVATRDVARAYMIDRLAGPKFPTVRWAASVFGKPSSRQRSHDYCRVGWRAAGVTIVLNRVGHSNPCTAGQPVGAVIKGKRWRTSRGLRVGQPLRELRLKYQQAQARPDGWWLLVVSRRSVLGRSRPEPTLMAHVSRRRIDAFVVS